MSTSQTVILFVMTIVGIVGTVVGLLAFVRAEHSLLHGSLIDRVYSDEDLRRVRRDRVPAYPRR
jgi:hypothetical protein